MNLLSGNFSLQLELTLESLLSQAVAAVGPDKDDQSPSSLNFSVEGDDSGGAGMPLEKSSTKLRLNGHLIQVVETQISCGRGDVPINASIIEMETL
jgi:hypothetical protein